MNYTEAEKACREAGFDPDGPGSLEDVRDLMLHMARKSGSWRWIGMQVLGLLEQSGAGNAERYCALCFALGAITSNTPNVGPALRFAAPLVAETLLKSD